MFRLPGLVDDVGACAGGVIETGTARGHSSSICVLRGAAVSTGEIRGGLRIGGTMAAGVKKRLHGNSFLSFGRSRWDTTVKHSCWPAMDTNSNLTNAALRRLRAVTSLCTKDTQGCYDYLSQKSCLWE